MLCLFDSSALVKLVVEEDDSEVAATLWDESDAVLASRLALPEVHAALAAAQRAGRLSPRSRRRATEDFAQFWRAVRVVEVDDRTCVDAAALAGRHVLGGADAVHLASAHRLADADVIVVAWDKRLRSAAMHSGLAIAPA